MNGQSIPIVISETHNDFSIIQNMLPFYLYELSRYVSDDVLLKKDNDYFESYFIEPSRTALLFKIDKEVIGFALINSEGFFSETEFNMGEFFIHAKFQGKGIGQQVVDQIWRIYSGIWEVPVIPENVPALEFWHKTIDNHTCGNYQCETKLVAYNNDQVQRIVFIFDTKINNVPKMQESLFIRRAETADIQSFTRLSYEKRRAYEKAQPQFWKYAGRDAEILQTKWFEKLLTRDDHIILTGESNRRIVAFIIGKVMLAPEVYNPGGLTLMIDDFCIENGYDWYLIGKKLVDEIKEQAKTKDAVQILVVCGAHDKPKQQFLKKLGLTVASEWYVGGIR